MANTDALRRLTSSIERGKDPRLNEHDLRKILRTRPDAEISRRLWCLVEDPRIESHLRQLAAELLVAVGHRAILPNVQKTLLRPGAKSDIRRYCAQILEQIGDSAATDHLLKILQSPAPESVKAAVVFALKSGGFSARARRRKPYFVAALRSAKTPELKIQLIEAVRVLNIRRAASQLNRMLDKDSARIQRHLIYAVADLRLKSAVPHLRKVLRHSGRTVSAKTLQADAMEALISLDGATPQELLERFVHGRDPYLAAVSKHLLQKTRRTKMRSSRARRQRPEESRATDKIELRQARKIFGAERELKAAV